MIETTSEALGALITDGYVLALGIIVMLYFAWYGTVKRLGNKKSIPLVVMGLLAYYIPVIIGGLLMIAFLPKGWNTEIRTVLTMLLGAAATVGLILLLRRHEKTIVNLPATVGKALYNSAKSDLDSPDVFRRMAAAGIWIFLVLLVSWLVGLFLKENLLEKSWLVEKLFGLNTNKEWNEWPKVFHLTAQIFLHHLVVVLVFVFLLNHFRIGRINLGYIFLFAYTVLTGLVVGTDSFTFYARTRIMALVTFVRFSLWQLVAYLLAVVSTTGLVAFSTPGWLQSTWGKVRSLKKLQFKGEEIEVLIYALLILLAASIAEARLQVFYFFTA